MYQVINIDQEILNTFDTMQEARSYVRDMGDRSILSRIAINGKTICWFCGENISNSDLCENCVEDY